MLILDKGGTSNWVQQCDLSTSNIIYLNNQTKIMNREAKMSDTIRTKKNELRAFLFIAIFLFPLLSVGLVGGYGFLIWMSQLLFGSGAY